MHSASFPCLLLSIRLSSDALEPMSECGYSNSPLLARDAKPGDAKLCGITAGIFSEPTNRTEPCLPPIRPIISTFNLIIFKLIRLVEQNFSLLLFTRELFTGRWRVPIQFFIGTKPKWSLYSRQHFFGQRILPFA